MSESEVVAELFKMYGKLAGKDARLPQCYSERYATFARTCYECVFRNQ